MFYIGGVLRGFDGLAEKAPAGFLLNKVLRRDFGPGVLIRGFCSIFRSTNVGHEGLLLHCFWTTIISILSSIYSTKDMQGFFLRDLLTFIICF